MTRIEIDYPRAVQLLREVVAEQGEDCTFSSLPHVGTCTYAYNHQPSCIIAHVLSHAGAPIEALVRLDSPGGEYEGSSIGELHSGGALEAENIWLSSPAARLLQRTQNKQDRGTPWGRAVRESIIEQPAS